MAVSLRAVHSGDQEFLFRLYAGTRLHEIAAFGWSPAQQEAFLRMQFTAQQRWYETAYAQAEQQIVMLETAPIGRVIVHRAGDATTLVDISLLPEHRGRGIGGGLIRELVQRCAQEGVPVSLQVLKTNPAARLYQRLGFVKTSEDEVYLQMEKRPG
jgi:ribosomal protein S18 acetylase RimI-like enzyme